MAGREQDKAKVSQITRLPEPHEKLTYSLELWHETDRGLVERILARASHATLARAIFEAALKEHPNRRIILRRGTRIIADSGR